MSCVVNLLGKVQVLDIRTYTVVKLRAGEMDVGGNVNVGDARRSPEEINVVGVHCGLVWKGREGGEL